MAAVFGAVVSPFLYAEGSGPRPTVLFDEDGEVHTQNSPRWDELLEAASGATPTPAPSAEEPAGEGVEGATEGVSEGVSEVSGPGIGVLTAEGTVPINSLSNVPCSVETGCSLAVILSDADGNLVPKIMTVQFYDMLPAE